MTVIENDKPRRGVLCYFGAAFCVYAAVDNYLTGERWPQIIMFLVYAVWMVRKQRQIDQERIARIEVASDFIRISRDNGEAFEVQTADVFEIPMNDFCARIDYRLNGLKKEFRLRKKSFTEARWRRIQSELKKVLPGAS